MLPADDAPPSTLAADMPVPNLRRPLRWLDVLLIVGALGVGLWLICTLRSPTHAVLQGVALKDASTGTLLLEVPGGHYAEPTPEVVQQLHQMIARLKPLHPPLPPPRAGDWLAVQKESGQSFAEYLRSHPNRPTPRRHTLYIQPLGPLDAQQRRIVELTAEFVRRYFNLPVKLRQGLPFSVVPASGFRWRKDLGALQMHSGTVLDQVLLPNLPPDAAAYIALTAVDLYPEATWNFVFGQASISDRVGVWSLARNGPLWLGEGAFRTVLLRTIKTATHEIGHMFGIRHCVAHPCNMNGANSLDEADRTPLILCPECMAKVCWLTGIDPGDWLRSLAAYCREQGLPLEAMSLERTLRALQRPQPVGASG